MADDMPNKYSYDAQTTSTTTQSREIGPDPTYIKTVPGILKIVEIALSLIAFICATVGYFAGAGWVQFVTISTFIGVLLLFIFHFMHIISRLPGPWLLIEFIYYCVYSVFMLIAAIVAAAGAWTGSVVAAAVFCFAALAVLAVDTFMMFRTWQGARQAGGGGEAATTTTTTTTTREQY